MVAKVCVACLRRWEPRPDTPPFADFCHDCFALIVKGKCPAGWQHQCYLAPEGLWAPHPVVVCREGIAPSRPFCEVHTTVSRMDALTAIDLAVSTQVMR